MSIFHPALGAVFAASVLWLTVRVVNRRESWAKWTLVVAIIVGCSVGCQIAFNAYVETVCKNLHQGR